MRKTAMVWMAAMVGTVAAVATGCAEAPTPEPFEAMPTSRAASSERSSGHADAGSVEADDGTTHGTTPTSKPNSTTSTGTTPSATPSGTPPTGTPDAGAKADGKANWEACASDAECGTNRCGCNGAAKMVCLPSADYPKTCVAPKPNWEACGSDAECATDRCGCNGGTAKVCLPSADYPKTCS